MKKLLILCFALLLAACSDEEASPKEQTKEETTSNKETSVAQEQLQWIFDNNENLHSPSDDEARILDYNTDKPIGASIYYDNRYEFDTNKYRMNIKLDEVEGQFLLGWDAPNTHAFYLINTTPVHSFNDDRPMFIELSDVMYNAMYGVDEFKEDAFVQITAADIDQDGQLEYVFYAIAPNEDFWYDLAIEVYEYYPNQQQPFERVVQVQTSTMGDSPIRITPAGEIIIDESRGYEVLVALCHKGEWYAVGDYFVNNGQHSANKVEYGANDQFDFENAARSEQNVKRVACKKKECADDIPPLTPKESTSSTPTSDRVEVIGVPMDGSNAILDLYTEDQLVEYIQDYVRLSMDAKNTGDYSIVKGYIAEGSPVDKDMVKSVPATYKKGIKIDHLGTEVEKIDIDVDYLYYTVVNKFEIFNSTYDAPVSFRSKYRVYVNGDIMQVEELLSDELLK